VDDYFHVVLGYGERRAIVHASTLVREPGPHFAVNGDAGSFVKYGMDPQEAALKAGRPAGSPDWGREDPANSGTFVDADGVRESVTSEPGAYADYYAGIAAAILTGAPPPVTAQSARDAIAVIELARQSSVERCTVIP
jgi:scyllo-inositol 2-dehydrogenase (NADP+)